MDMEFIRKRITELRLAKGVSELAMSQALGHGRAYITHITSGRAKPSVTELLYIIEYLDVTPRTFFTEGTENESVLLQKIMDRLQKHSEDDLALFLALLDRMPSHRAAEPALCAATKSSRPFDGQSAENGT